MRRIRESLRLVWKHGMTCRSASRACGVSRTTVCEYVARARAAKLTWEAVEGLDEGELERRLFAPAAEGPAGRVGEEWKGVHLELRRKGVTLRLLWEEYKEREPEGYGYSRYCDLYRKWRSKLDPPMRQRHKAGERLFVDYAGQTIGIVDRETGEERGAQLFVAVLGASNYTYAEATWTQSLSDWIESHVRALEFLGGRPEIVTPDNPKVGVTSACRYDPELNPTYQEWARHYEVAVIPARPGRPRDKAKVENGVLVAERWILARLRHRTFFSLEDTNRAIRELMVELNERPFQKLPGSRRSQFELVDRPVLRPLPVQRYAMGEWKKVRVNIDYHVEVEGHYYSVPYRLVKEELEARIGGGTVELFHKGRRVASHRRSEERGRHTTVSEHMPRQHREYLEWTPERLVDWAFKSGPSVAGLVGRILASRPHPEQGFRASLGLIRLGKRYGPERLEAACRRALVIGATRFRSVRSILESGLDREPLPEPVEARSPIDHDNIRGADYFSEGGAPC